MSSIDHEMADTSKEVDAPKDQPKTENAGLPLEVIAKDHEMADASREVIVIHEPVLASTEEQKPIETPVVAPPIEQDAAQATDLEMSDNVKEEVSAPVPVEEPKTLEALENVGQSVNNKEKVQNTDHEMADELPRTSPSVAGPAEAPPQNAGLSAGSGSGSGSGTISDEADESALHHLNVDSDDSDSALGDMTPQTSTMSVNSSIYNYVEENGRTYHRYKEGKYMLPNDEDEMDRLDLQHQLWLITLYDELALSPVANPQNVLDIGTGTGIWAIEYANRNPSAHVIGTDLSPIQPEFVPPNCQFEVDDAEDEWNYSKKFDLIHGRALVTCFKQPLHVITSAFEALNPGGYLEFHDLVMPLRDIDGTLQDTALDVWQTKTIDAAASLGATWKWSANYPQFFEQAGFTDIVVQHFQWPINRWPKGEHMKTIGSYWGEDLRRGLEGLSMAALTRGAGMTREEVLELTAAARKDLLDKRIHAYLPIVVVYGRKPEVGEI